MLFLGPALSTFPLAAPGALVMFAALRLIDFAELRRIAPVPAQRAVLGVGHHRRSVDLRCAVRHSGGRSIVDSGSAAPHRPTTRWHLGLRSGTGWDARHRRLRHPAGRCLAYWVYRYDAPLFFANAEDFKHRALAAVDAADPPVEWFLLNAEANTEIDLTASTP